VDAATAAIANRFLDPLDNEHVLFPWVLLGVLFLIPFVDLRRPLRLHHLDLLVLLLLGAGPVLPYASEAQLPGSTLMIVVGLAYLATRLLYAGFRPSEHRELLTPLLPTVWLAVALVVVLGLRVGYLLDDRQIAFDVGVASVAGADRISDGRELYVEPFETGPYSDRGRYSHFDTYGPSTYLLYLPFELALPWGGGVIGEPGYDDPDAAHVAAITFDLLVMLVLFLLGRRVRAGPDGRLLGLALVYAWASYPYTLFVLRYSFNDMLVALLVLGAFLAIAHPAGRGLLAALAAASKFAPGVLAPLLATGTGERRLRSWLVFGGVFAAVLAAMLLPLLPPGGLSELWDRTVGYQLDREGPLRNSLWLEFPDLDWLQTLTQIGLVGLALALAVVPRRRSVVQLAALGAGLIAAAQLTMTYWVPAYLVWFAPIAFLALFAPHSTRRRAV
jgi:Glycosyltransferase family 87